MTDCSRVRFLRAGRGTAFPTQSYFSGGKRRAKGSEGVEGKAEMGEEESEGEGFICVPIFFSEIFVFVPVTCFILPVL